MQRYTNTRKPQACKGGDLASTPRGPTSPPHCQHIVAVIRLSWFKKQSKHRGGASMLLCISMMASTAPPRTGSHQSTISSQLKRLPASLASPACKFSRPHAGRTSARTPHPHMAGRIYVLIHTKAILVSLAHASWRGDELELLLREQRSLSGYPLRRYSSGDFYLLLYDEVV
jgi:hypothetical protein